MRRYEVIDSFKGYQNKIDITKLAPGTLVHGSQNVQVTQTGRIVHRAGFILDGNEGADVDGGIVASYDWITNTADERNIRAGGTVVECRFVEGDDILYKTILSSVSPSFEFTSWWDASEQMDVLLGVNGGSGIYSWSGATAQVDITGSTGSTIKLSDAAATWAASRFINGGGTVTYDKKLTIGAIEYTYTGGVSTHTLTGVTPDPTAGGHSNGDWAIQTMTLHADTPASDATLYPNDIISVLYNQVWIGSKINREIYISKQTDFTDWVLTNPRNIGDPAIFNLDASAVAFAPGDEDMKITAGGEYWYKVTKQLSADGTSEALILDVMKAGAKQGAVNQGLTFSIKNNTAFISAEPTLDTLGKVENIVTSQSVPLSDPIKNDFDVYDFSRGHGKFFRNDMYVALPLESKVIVFNVERGEWEAPWIMPAGRLAIIGGELYMHSNVSLTTYKMFSGQNDNGGAIIARAIFSYQNDGDRVNYKKFNERFTEGYISPNTVFERVDNIDWEGVNGSLIQEILGTDSRIILSNSAGNPLGASPLGSEPLGSTVATVLPKQRFRCIKANIPTNYRELQVGFQSDGIDNDWEITAFGKDTVFSSHNNSDITI